jgi:hypothetical protein
MLFSTISRFRILMSESEELDKCEGSAVEVQVFATLWRCVVRGDVHVYPTTAAELMALVVGCGAAAVVASADTRRLLSEYGACKRVAFVMQCATAVSVPAQLASSSCAFTPWCSFPPKRSSRAACRCTTSGGSARRTSCRAALSCIRRRRRHRRPRRVVQRRRRRRPRAITTLQRGRGARC